MSSNHPKNKISTDIGNELTKREIRAIVSRRAKELNESESEDTYTLGKINAYQEVIDLFDGIFDNE